MNQETFNAICEISGFTRGTIYVPELKLTIKKNILFKYWEVPNVDIANNILENMFGNEISNENEESDTAGMWGKFSLLLNFNAYAHYILVEQGLGPISRTYARGHEFGHLVQNLSDIALVFEKFRHREKLVDFFNANPDFLANKSEAFACFCGILAMHNEGFPSRYKPAYKKPHLTKERSEYDRRAGEFLDGLDY